MPARAISQSITRPDASLRRALFVAAIIVLWMFAVGVRLVHLQVSGHDEMVDRARRQQQNAIETAPERGRVLDRNGNELARSIDTDSIFVAPDELIDPGDPNITAANVECTADALASSIGLEKAKLGDEISQGVAKGRRFIWIARRLSPEVGNVVRAQTIPGVHIQKEPKRFYPNGGLASHILGFVGLDNVGLGGIEKVYNEKIAGEPGKLFVENDSRGKAYESFEVPSKPGQTVVLTIDQSVQYRAEQAILTTVQKSRAKSGTAIVLDPRNGEILALASVPTFDPNDIAASSQQERSNWALQNVYEPGSTFKIVAFSAALEKGLVKPEDRIDCQMGGITVAGRRVRDHSAFGSLTIREALEKSSNVAAIKLGIRVGNETMYDYIKRFGFGSRTGIELAGETPGLLAPVNRWHPSSIGSIAIGQEIAVTPLQMVAAFGTLANNGIRVAPHLVREIRTSSGTAVYQAHPEERRVVNETTASALRGMLEGVTLNGTAKQAQLDGYTAAGKTGTAQKIDPKTRAYSHTKHIASFVGFAPVSNPSVVIVVVIDEPGGAYHGGQIAAPVFREIAEQILPDLGVAPDTDFKTPLELIASEAGTQTAPAAPVQREAAVEENFPKVAGRDGKGGDVVYANAGMRGLLMPNLQGRSVRDVARACQQLGLKLEAKGEGFAFRQSVSPGAEVQPGQIVHVEFARRD
ncbi:MAG TPA: penicillin-binding protein [Pyrinomonadaceae bacterium]|nr:penicillin-binding protein [Pyrinomonadaceae bacterium]